MFINSFGFILVNDNNRVIHIIMHEYLGSVLKHYRPQCCGHSHSCTSLLTKKQKNIH